MAGKHRADNDSGGRHVRTKGEHAADDRAPARDKTGAGKSVGKHQSDQISTADPTRHTPKHGK